MNRRNLVRGAGLGAVAAAGLAAPATAQALPEVKWRLTSSFPKSLDTLYGAAENLSRRVAALTGGKFQIRTFAAGEIVPPLQALDAVQNGTVECCQTASYYYTGKDLTFAFDSALPFGLNTRQQNAWVRQGGGLALMREFYKDYNVTSFLMTHTGAQMGGWFRREIKTVDDLKGLKMRVAGVAGQVLQKLGVIPQQIGGSDIYPALERGAIDAAEWVGPYDDRKLGLNQVAPYYYYPGWWEGGTGVSLYCNLQAYSALPDVYKEVLDVVTTETAEQSIAKYDVLNPRALRELVASGTKLVPFPTPVLEACFNAANEVFAQAAATNPKFKRVYEPWTAFRREQVLWFRVAETTFDSFMGRQSAANRI